MMQAHAYSTWGRIALELAASAAHATRLAAQIWNPFREVQCSAAAHTGSILAPYTYSTVRQDCFENVAVVLWSAEPCATCNLY